MDFAVPEDHKVKIKRIKKIDKYLDLARGLKNNMRVTEMIIIVGVLENIWKK